MPTPVGPHRIKFSWTSIQLPSESFWNGVRSSPRGTVIDIFDGEQAPVGNQGRDARGPYLVTPQPSEAFSAKALLPTPDDGLGLSGSPLDLAGGSKRMIPVTVPDVSNGAKPGDHRAYRCA